MNEGLTRNEKIFFVIGVIVLVSIILFILFVFMPWDEAERLNYFKDHQKTKTGKIILVIPEGGLHDPDGAVHFEDGDIMKKWQREDYSDFRKYINQQVEIIYGEVRMCKDCSVQERKLFEINPVVIEN